jgi:hypothetical protein
MTNLRLSLQTCRCEASSRIKYLLIYGVLGVILCRSLSADVDSVVRLEGRTLVGLPTQYAPAELDLEALHLRVGRHAMEFCPFLRGFFKRQPYDLQILGCWSSNQARGGSPPYLVLEITPKARDYTYRLKFDLNTLRLLGISVALRSATVPPEAFTVQTLQVALTDLERKEIDDSIRVVR